MGAFRGGNLRVVTDPRSAAGPPPLGAPASRPAGPGRGLTSPLTPAARPDTGLFPLVTRAGWAGQAHQMPPDERERTTMPLKKREDTWWTRASAYAANRSAPVDPQWRRRWTRSRSSTGPAPPARASGRGEKAAPEALVDARERRRRYVAEPAVKTSTSAGGGRESAGPVLADAVLSRPATWRRGQEGRGRRGGRPQAARTPARRGGKLEDLLFALVGARSAYVAKKLRGEGRGRPTGSRRTFRARTGRAAGAREPCSSEGGSTPTTDRRLGAPPAPAPVSLADAAEEPHGVTTPDLRPRRSRPRRGAQRAGAAKKSVEEEVVALELQGCPPLRGRSRARGARRAPSG